LAQAILAQTGKDGTAPQAASSLLAMCAVVGTARRSKSCGAAPDAARLPQLVPQTGAAAQQRPQSLGRGSGAGSGAGVASSAAGRRFRAPGTAASCDRLPPIGGAGCAERVPVRQPSPQGKGRPARRPAAPSGQSVSLPPPTQVTAATPAAVAQTASRPSPGGRASSGSRPPRPQPPKEHRDPPSRPAAAVAAAVSENGEGTPNNGQAQNNAGGGSSGGRRGKSSAAAEALKYARGIISNELADVLEEEVVTYAWKRGGAKKSSASSSTAVPATQRTSAGVTLGSPSFGQSPRQDTLGTDQTTSQGAPSAKQPSPHSAQTASESSPLGAPAESQPSHEGGCNPDGAVAHKKGVRFQAGVPSKETASREIVPVVAGKRTAASASRPAPSKSTMAQGIVNLEAAERLLGARKDACSAAVELQFKLIAYDGSKPQLCASPLAKACGGPLRAWLDGQLSGPLACLYVDDWVQGEVTWEPMPGGLLQQHLGSIAGMLADAALERSSAAQLQDAVFKLQPAEVSRHLMKAAVGDQATEADVPKEMLVSEVEHALTQYESRSYGQGPAKRLEAAVQRELFRLLWTEVRQESAEFEVDDKWLLAELAHTPQAAYEAAATTPLARLRQENEHLESYLIRMLRLKRSLVALLDSLEKVDHYAILGVPPTASDKELKNAYRKACLRLHPDKGGDKQQFQQLQDAYARILEERSKQKQAGQCKETSTQQQAQPQPQQQGQQKSKSAGGTAGTGGTGTVDGTQLAIEGPAGEAATEAATEVATAEVRAAEGRLREDAGPAQQCVKEAEQADAKIRQLRQQKDQDLHGVQALETAQDASEKLMVAAEGLGKLGPRLGELVMEVAESSLLFAARSSSVPAAMLLTDVALSCTLEASRILHSAKTLLEVRGETVTTLQTLKTNLSMAKIIGTIDDETLRLSLGLVEKAATRIMSVLRLVGGALADSLQRGRQCLVHARSVAAFAAGRSAAEEAAADDGAGLAALPAPEGSGSTAPPPQPKASEHPGPSTKSPSAASPPSAGKPSPQQSPPAASREKMVLEARLQNDRMLRQLNTDLLELQGRARAHLAKHGGAQAMNDIPSETRAQVLELAAEVLLLESNAASFKITSMSNSPEMLFGQHFDFVETCGAKLAMPVDLRAQLLRLAALLDAPAVIDALQKQVRPRLVATLGALAEEQRVAAEAALEGRMETLVEAVVACRVAA